MVAAVTRVMAAGGELWLDEIWSFRLAQLLTSPAGVFTVLHHDNNHHLNSLYLYFWKESPLWIGYRFHALAAGVGTVILSAVIARREAGRAAALAAAAVIGASFLMTLYSSEARGYALAVFFSFLAVPLAAMFLGTAHLRWAAAYASAAVLGLLSHLTFVHALLGLIAWTAYRAARSLRGRPVMSSLALLHAVPLAALAALYWIDLRHAIVGGGPVLSASEVAASVASLAVGGPEEGSWRGAAALAASVACVVSIFAVRRSGSDLWVLFAVSGVAAPILTLAIADPTLLFERYFVVAAAFVTLSYAWLIAAASDRSRWIAVGLIGTFVLFNAAHTLKLIERGRGGYMAALQHMSEQSIERPVTIGGDHDFRQGRLVEFYRDFVDRGEEIEYHTPPEWGPAGPEWMLTHSQAGDFAPPVEMTVLGGRRYRLSRVYPYAGLSGWHLAVYHNALARRP